MKQDADVLVIGCGPGGSTAATVLAQAGRRVLVLEKEHFPRFHIGESLLPYNRSLFDDLGVTLALEEAAFPRKYGAQFHLASGAASHRFEFRHGRFTRQHEGFQVERSRFDYLLLQHARKAGAEVREGWSFRRFTTAADGVEVEAVDGEGQAHTLRAAFLLDASGRANCTGNQESLRILHPRHRKVAVFGHFAGVRQDAGELAGDTVIVRAERHWFWIIPISETKTSVGLVLDPDELASHGKDFSAAFASAVAASPVMRDRLAEAAVKRPLQQTSDFSYSNRSLIGSRLLRIGDAAGFMDPIFSAGVYLAMWSGRLAAQAVSESLARGDDPRRRFRSYEKRVGRAMRLFWRLVEHFYTQPFMELFLNPRPGFDVPAAVVAILAGDVEPKWALRWRLEVFFLLARIQARWPLVPRIDFSAGPVAATAKPA